jgi:DNA segregation ATPase FtsK/SpoIIIE-like protein
MKNTSTLAWDGSKLVGHKLPIGIDNFGNVIYWDWDNQSTPHVLLCGATGSGKSVFLRSTIEYALLSGVHEVYIFDPKHEFKGYSSTSGVKVVCDIEEIELQIMMLVEEMENRVKNGINKKTLVVFDEFADAVANSRKGNDLKNYGEEIVGTYANGATKTKRVVKSIDKSLEENLRVLLQKGRSCGFRIISATQRASTKIITGDAKVNYGSLICMRVPKSIDSQVVLDEEGAESLNGNGDFLLKSSAYLNTVRGQGFYKE